MSVHRFEAVLGGEAGDLPGVVLPAAVAAAMGGRARIPVPADLAAALDADAAVVAAFEAMSYTHRKEWVAAVEGPDGPRRALAASPRPWRRRGRGWAERGGGTGRS